MLCREAEARKTQPLPYTGEVTAQEAWDMLREDAMAALVDVRSQPEWGFVGIPDLTSLSKQPVYLSWRLYPGMDVYSHFLEKLQLALPDKETPIFFLCRTGGRSLDAACAAANAGYRYAFNVTDGFEGPKDAAEHRGAVAGWKASRLPWRQE